MGQPFVGEIRMFGGNFSPAGWRFCDGRLLPISENETLFNLIGTTYGGDGQNTFALPDLRGRLPIHQGGGFILAQNGGVEEVTLSVNQMPAHSHPMLASSNNANQTTPQTTVLANPTVIDLYRAGETGGSETVTLLESEIPSHSHLMTAATTAGNSKAPAGNAMSCSGNGNVYLPPAGNPLVAMSDQALTPAGGSLPHKNLQPYLTLNFCIALQGIFPPRD